jgi:hypothetical protein
MLWDIWWARWKAIHPTVCFVNKYLEDIEVATALGQIQIQPRPPNRPQTVLDRAFERRVLFVRVWGMSLPSRVPQTPPNFFIGFSKIQPFIKHIIQINMFSKIVFKLKYNNQ